MRAQEFTKNKTKNEAEMPWKDAVDAGAMTTQQGAKVAASDISQAINDLSTTSSQLSKEISSQQAAAASIPSNVTVTSVKPDGSWTGRENPATTKIGPISITKGTGNPAAGGAVKRKWYNMKFQDLVSRNVAYHKALNPKAWDGDNLRPEVRNALLKIAKQFVAYLEIPNFEVLDIVLTGSMANYNYTRYSDYDLHVITRYSDLDCDDLAEAFYRAKKTLWNNEHDITIYGNEVELYVEDIDEPPVSAGVYSVINDRWLKQPGYQPPEIDDRAVSLKVRDLIKQIEVAVESADDPEDLARIKDKLRRMRRSGLDTGGEYSTENLAFKILRNMGYLDLLNNAYTQQQDQQFSLR